MAIVVIRQQHGMSSADHHVEPTVDVEVGCDRIALEVADVDNFRGTKHACRVRFEVIDRGGSVVSNDDFAAAVLIEVCQEHVTRAEAYRNPDLWLESAVSVADEDGDTIVELPSVRVPDIQIPVSVEIADANARRIGPRGVANAREEGPVAPVHAHADAVAWAHDRVDEVGPAVAVEVADRHVSWNVVPPVFDLDPWRVPSD